MWSVPPYGGDALEMAALLAEEEGRPSLACRLLEASCTLRQGCGEPVGGTRAISGMVRDCLERLESRLESRLEVTANGPPLSPSEAIAVALAELAVDRAAATPR